MDDVEQARGRIRRAERKIEAALDTLVSELGPGWLLDIDVGAIDVSTVGGPPAWRWRARIEAKLAGGDR